MRNSFTNIVMVLLVLFLLPDFSTNEQGGRAAASLEERPCGSRGESYLSNVPLSHFDHSTLRQQAGRLEGTAERIEREANQIGQAYWRDRLLQCKGSYWWVDREQSGYRVTRYLMEAKDNPRVVVQGRYMAPRQLTRAEQLNRVDPQPIEYEGETKLAFDLYRCANCTANNEWKEGYSASRSIVRVKGQWVVFERGNSLQYGIYHVHYWDTRKPMCAADGQIHFGDEDLTSVLPRIPNNVAFGKPVRIETNGADDVSDAGAGCNNPSEIADGFLKRPGECGQDGVVGFQNHDYGQLMEVRVTINLQGTYDISRIWYNPGDVVRANTWNADVMITPLGRSNTKAGQLFSGEWTGHAGSITASSVTITFQKTRNKNEEDWLLIGEIQVIGTPAK